MNGLNLAEMNVSDMLDVVHYFYEEDLKYTSIEDAKWTDARRIAMYKEMYGTTYKYAASPKATGDNDSDELTPFNTGTDEIKPFIPATDFNPESANPFGKVLDAPIG